MDLIKIALSTKDFWLLPPKPWFHHLVCLITSQEISFFKGRKIRQMLLKWSGGLITPEYIISESRLGDTGLSSARVETLKRVAELGDLTHVKGIGPWTIKGLKILLLSCPNQALYEDKWIRARLGELYSVKTLNINQAKIFFSYYPNYQTILSYFFWRIKPSGINKLKSMQTLIREDFV